MAPANGQPRLTGRCGLRSLLAFEVLPGMAPGS